MNDEQAPARTDTPGELASGPTLVRVRRRGESHLLALMSAAAVVFVAIAIAKPWGESAPPPAAPAATPSLVVETAQPVVIVVQPGEVPTTLTVVCTEDPRVSPWVVGSAEPVMGLQRITQPLVCTGANLQWLEWVLPSPSAP